MDFYSSTEWNKIREKKLENNKRCAVCGTTDNLDVHHKTHLKNGGNNEPENLIVLCNSHHQKIHTLEAFYLRNHSPKSFERLFVEVKRKAQN